MQKIFDALTVWLSKPGSFGKVRNGFFLLLVMGAMGLYVRHEMLNEVDQSPCSPSQYPGRCYRINQDVCESMWVKSNAECNDQISQLQLSPTRLIGPIMLKCQVVKLDRLFNSARLSNPDCNELHSKLDQWKQTNPDF